MNQMVLTSDLKESMKASYYNVNTSIWATPVVRDVLVRCSVM